MKPLTIIGGGISGLALGQALQKEGVPVTLTEKGQYPRHRVCGEFLAGLSTHTLQTLHLENLLRKGIPAHSVTWFRGDRLLRRYPLPQEVYGLSRYSLDQTLANHFTEAGGTLQCRQTAQPPKPGTEGVIQTTGKLSGQSDWLGLKAHYRELPITDDLEMHLGEEAYLGLSRVGDGRVNVCGLFRRRRGLRASRETILPAYLQACGLESLTKRLATGTVDPDSFCACSGFVFGQPPTPADPGLLRLGDAGGMIPPFTGNGMTMAFEGAALALAPMIAYSQGEQSWKEAVQEVQKKQQATFSGRLRRSLWLQKMLQTPTTQNLLEYLTRSRLLPFRLLYHLSH